MSRMLRVIHSLHYTFGFPREDAVATVRLCPLDGPGQRLLHHRLQTCHEPAFRLLGNDRFGNAVSELMWEELPELRITAMSAIELRGSQGRLGDLAAAPFAASSPMAPIAEEFAAMGRAAFSTQPPEPESLLLFGKLMRSCLGHNSYWERVRRPAGDALRDGEGGHADFAHIAISVLRSLGHAACYINGYLLPPAGAGTAKPHAWVAVFLPQRGWIELDPMLGCAPDLRHVAMAVGRDRSDVEVVQSPSLTAGLHQVRTTLTFYPLTRKAIPTVACTTALAC